MLVADSIMSQMILSGSLADTWLTKSRAGREYIVDDDSRGALRRPRTS
jgi:hypothetical protein